MKDDVLVDYRSIADVDVASLPNVIPKQTMYPMDMALTVFLVNPIQQGEEKSITGAGGSGDLMQSMLLAYQAKLEELGDESKFL